MANSNNQDVNDQYQSMVTGLLNIQEEFKVLYNDVKSIQEQDIVPDNLNNIFANDIGKCLKDISMLLGAYKMQYFFFHINE